jgi:hypothetical protein
MSPLLAATCSLQRRPGHQRLCGISPPATARPRVSRRPSRSLLVRADATGGGPTTQPSDKQPLYYYPDEHTPGRVPVVQRVFDQLADGSCLGSDAINVGVHFTDILASEWDMQDKVVVLREEAGQIIRAMPLSIIVTLQKQKVCTGCL